MIDLHSHILPNIDDGSKSFSESLNILKQASDNGVTDIVVTPHFIFGSTFNSPKNKNKELLAALKKEAEAANININLYLGNEIYADNELLTFLKKKQASSLNNTKYVLFELPMNNEFKGLKQLIFNLQSNGYVPVIAHPERYRLLKENPKLIEELLAVGVLFQSNIASLTCRYGKEAKNTLELFLKHRMITFLSSDIHHDSDSFYASLPHIKKILQKLVDDEYIESLLNTNAKKLLLNEKIEPQEFISLKKNIFNQYK